MSRNSSVAVLADCTDLYNSHVSLTGLNGPPSVESIENETILTNNTDISPRQVMSSVSFQERVRCTDLATLFPRGSLNQNLKKKKKKISGSSLSTSQLSGDISSVQNNTNVTLSDENLSASLDAYPGNNEESSKPFNKRLYLKKKSINISFDSSSLNDSEKSGVVLKRNCRVVNVVNLPQYDKTNDSLNAVDEVSEIVFKKNLYLKKKSINISFDTSSISDPITEENNKDNSQVGQVPLEQSSFNITTDTKSDNSVSTVEPGENCSEENSRTREAKSMFSSNDISCQVNEINSLEEKIVNGNTSKGNLTIDRNHSNITKNNEHLPKDSDAEALEVQKRNDALNGKNINESFEISNDIDEEKHKSTTDKEMHSNLSTNDSLKAKSEESAEVFIRDFYLKKKPINLPIDSSSLNDTNIEKTINRSGVADVSLNHLSPKLLNVTESAECTPISLERSQILETEQESIKLFNKTSYMKKKSLKIVFDESSIKDAITEKSLEENSPVGDTTLDPLSSEIANVTETAEGFSSFEGPENLKGEEKSAKLFNKNLYLKKKSIKISFDESSLKIPTPEKNVDGNNQITDNSKIKESCEDVANFLEGSQKMETRDKSAKVFNKNLYLKKKSINISFDESSLNDPTTERSVEESNITDASKITNITESPVNVSASMGGSQKLETGDESAKIFNKNLYLKRKSINISFDESSLNDPTPEKTIDENDQISDTSKIMNFTESPVNVSVSFEGSQKIETGDESAKVFNKNLYLKKKSFNISFDESLNDPAPEKTIEENYQITDTSSKITNVMEPAENVAHLEGSQKMEIDESVKVFDKNLYLKKKSINILFDESSVNDYASGKTIAGSDQSTNISSKVINIRESPENVSLLEGSQTIGMWDESANVDNTNEYHKKKSIHVSSDKTSLNEPTPEKIIDGIDQITDASSKITNVTESPVKVSASFKGNNKMETARESDKVFDKNVYLKKKSINISFDESSLNDPTTIRSVEENNHITDASKIANITESPLNVSASLGGSQNMEITNESAKVFSKDLYLKKKSINISFDESSLNDPTTVRSVEENTKTTNVTEPPVNVCLSMEGSQKMETGDESAYVCNKNEYHKKKYINVSSDITSINDPTPEKTAGEIDQITNASTKISNIIDSSESIHVPCNGTFNDQIPEKTLQKGGKVSDSSEIKTVTEPPVDVSVSLEGSQKMETGDESGNGCNNEDHKNVSCHKTSLNEPPPEKTVEGINQITDASSKITNISELPVNVSTSLEGNNKMYTAHEPDKVFEKNVYLKKKSINISFDETSICDATPEKTESPENVIASLEGSQKMDTRRNESDVLNKNEYLEKKCIHVSINESSINDPTPEKIVEEDNKITDDSSKIINITESPDNVIASLERSHKMETSKDECDVLNKNESLDKKSVHVSCNESSINDPAPEKIVEENYQITDASSSITEPSGNISASLDRSPKIETGDEPANLVKKKSIHIPCNRSLNDPIPEKTLEGNDQITPASSKIINTTESPENVSPLEGSEKLETGNESTTLKKKSIHISCNKSLNDQDLIPEKTLEGDNKVSEGSSEIKNVIVSPVNVSTSLEGSQKVETEKESAEVFNKNEYRKKKSINISFDSTSLKDPVPEKSLEGDDKVADGPSKITIITEPGNSTTASLEGSKKMETENEKMYSSPKLRKQTRSSIRNKQNLTNDSLKVRPAKENVSARCSKRKKSTLIDPQTSNVSKRCRKGDKNCSVDFENSAKKNKTSTSGNGTDDFIKDISIIPNPKPFTRSRVMYHSTPINRRFSKKNISKLKMEGENIQQDDKMIQVSKSIFGSSTEVTNTTVSKKKSMECTNYSSSPCNEKSGSRTKRKSNSLHTEIKKLQKMESISESRSYHSNFISTFEDDISYQTTRKSIKKVAFKSISSDENSTSGYGNSSDEYAPINRKSVGFRDAISLIEDTVSNSSEGDIRDAINSDSNIVNPNLIGINDTPAAVNESKSRIDRTDLSLNYSAEVPDIILAENEIECTEMSEECSLFNKLIAMAENKRSDKNVPKIQNKLPKGRKKSVMRHVIPDPPHREKWVSPNLIKFLHNKLMTDDLDHVVNTDRIVSILCSAVCAIEKLQDVNDIDFALLPLKNILLKFKVCCNMIEYCTFISRFTPSEFQRKALPLEGYFGSCKRGIKKKLTDPILTEDECIFMKYL